MSRKKKLVINTTVSLLHQLLGVLCGFIVPRAILVHYGSATNGLVNSITQFLGFISMLECGMSAVIQANMYAPLANKDNEALSRIFVSGEKFFRKIAYALVGYVVVLTIVYPTTVKENFSILFTALLVVVISISLFVQFYFGISYRILLNADQCSYVFTSIQCIIVVLNTVLSLILINLNASIHLVQLVTSLMYLLQPILMKIYVNLHYELNRKIIYAGEPIKQKWNGLAQHIAFMVVTRTDTIVLTILSTLQNVSVYAIYNLVVSGIVSVFDSLNIGIAPLVGSMLANNEKKRLDDFFDLFEWLWHMATICIFTITGVVIVPFVSVYTKGINDANYIVPVFATLITLAQGVRVIRTPYNIVVSAAGHYKQTQVSSIIEALLNVVISVIGVFHYGLVGVALGTLVAMLYRTLYLPWYLSKHILFRKQKYFWYNTLVDILCMVLMILTTSQFSTSVDNYVEWFFLALKVGVICLFETVFICVLFNCSKLKKALEFIREK